MVEQDRQQSVWLAPVVCEEIKMDSNIYRYRWVR